MKSGSNYVGTTILKALKERGHNGLFNISEEIENNNIKIKHIITRAFTTQGYKKFYTHTHTHTHTHTPTHSTVEYFCGITSFVQ
jgi:hypothetical protein